MQRKKISTWFKLRNERHVCCEMVFHSDRLHLHKSNRNWFMVYADSVLGTYHSIDDIKVGDLGLVSYEVC